MRTLTWNLFHGRSRPPAGRPLLTEFASALAGWDWDVALLQEVPPWWPPTLAWATRSEQHTVLTSRNAGLAIRRAIASRAPDLIRSNGGGANTILVRGGGGESHSRARLAWRPERRLAHGIRLPEGWVVNLHASVRPPERIPGDVARARAAALDWAGGARIVIGGDFNLRAPRLPGFTPAAHSWVDHILVRGWEAKNAEILDAGTLSDHRPLAVELSPSE